MAKFKKFTETQEITESKLTDILKNVYNSGIDFTKTAGFAIKREGSETIKALEILNRLVMSKDVSKKEKLFLKNQSVDLAKSIPFVALQLIPGSVAITTLLVVLGKKYKFDFLPNSHKRFDINNL